MDKKGVNIVTGTIVFILLVLVFFAPVSLAVTRVGSQATLEEQVYSKQIAGIIDKSSVGMEIELEMFDAYRIARKNNVEGNIVFIDNGRNEVTVKLAKGRGYVSSYFNNVNVVWDLDREDRLVILKIVEPISRLEEVENELE